MTITIKEELDFNDIKNKVWSGAVDTIKVIEDHNKEDEFMNLLSSIYCDTDIETLPTMTTINDLLWFDDEWIFEQLNIENNQTEE